ncbi:phosphatase PAP2 family protein [Anaeromyxobacter sp. PSR-1]|uniref:phosphatase PAP2 family protein n=1 Tax=unclassified Anaeromyxobacter TaxID=2620896 RepID=UPI0005E6E861|nr:phosphatase PAP2 family protein [Anaeromyxobacter sp. PSR-1]GAO04457.1 PAP2 superfamily protein [Anaeromyxobacter sp. PSR-1]
MIALAAALALALAQGSAAASEETEPGPFLGEGTRYADLPVVRRVLLDLVAIPADAPRWSAPDAAGLALTLGAGLALMWPAEPSPDVRLDRWITRELNPHLPVVWNDVVQPALWGGIAVGGLGTWWLATRRGDAYVAQGCSLMAEALTVAQAYHVSVKLLVGREGPRDGEGEGRVLGPRASLRLYPAGTPSGHAATLYSLLSAGTAYFEPPLAAQLGLHALVGGLVAFHVIDHRHFLSDSLLGSVLGWSVGRWVVLHRRSSPDAPPSRGPSALALVPLALPSGGGLALAGSL